MYYDDRVDKKQGKDSDDERTILGLASAGLGHWMGGNKVEGTKVAEFGISA